MAFYTFIMYFFLAVCVAKKTKLNIGLTIQTGLERCLSG